MLLVCWCNWCISILVVQIANHPLLIRRIYSDEDVIRIARKLHPIGAFGFECSLDRVIEEVKSYNDFRIHQVKISLFPKHVSSNTLHTKLTCFSLSLSLYIAFVPIWSQRYQRNSLRQTCYALSKMSSMRLLAIHFMSFLV